MSSDINNANQMGLFAGLSDEIYQDYIKNLRRLSYQKGEALILEKTPGDCLYVLAKGRVEISKGLDNPDTPTAQLSVLEEGDFFGEMSLLNDEPRSASVMTLTDVELIEIPRNVFVNISFSHPVVMFNLIRTLSCRLRVTNERFSDLMNEMITKNRLLAIGMTASKIMHDIKTPLTVITLNTQLIESLYPESSELTASIIKQVKLVEELVKETLDYVKGSPTALQLSKIDLDAFLRDLKETYGASLKGREIDLIIENKCPGHVYFDEERIRRVVINLLRNSSEAFSQPGEIKLLASLASNWLQISVIDNGPGIPESVALDLFKPFVTYGKQYGTGLGLAICQKLVQEHNGRLDFKPIEPHGSRFDIRIPQNLN